MARSFQGSTAGRRRLVWTLPAMLLLGACSKHQADIPVAFPGNLPDPGVVEQCLEHDRQLLGQYQPQETAQRLLESLQAFNRLAADAQASPADIEAAFGQLKERARELLRQQGRQQFRRVVLYALDNFMKALDEFLLRANRQATQALSQGQPLPDELRQAHQRLVGWGADFLRHALLAGLLRLEGERLAYAPAGRFYVRVAFKVRLASLFPELNQPLKWLLDDQERVWYYYWVVEHSRSATPERRLRAIDELVRLKPGFPELEARGIVHFQAGHYGAARADFEMALEKRPSDRRLRNWLEQARRREKEKRSGPERQTAGVRNQRP